MPGYRRSIRPLPVILGGKGWGFRVTVSPGLGVREIAQYLHVGFDPLPSGCGIAVVTPARTAASGWGLAKIMPNAAMPTVKYNLDIVASL